MAAQIASTLVLLVGAVLLAQSFLRAQREDPGYPAKNVLIVHIDRPSSSTFVREAQDRIGGMPGVIAVGGIKQFFLRRNPDQRVTIEGRVGESSERAPRLAVDAVTPGYFRLASPVTGPPDRRLRGLSTARCHGRRDWGYPEG